MTPFTGAILPAGKARAAPLCLHNKQCATWPAVKSARPSVACIGPPSAQRAIGRRLPDALHRAARRAYPGDPIRVMKGVIISAPRYYAAGGYGFAAAQVTPK
jgi:hypothetical protein